MTRLSDRSERWLPVVAAGAMSALTTLAAFHAASATTAREPALHRRGPPRRGRDQAAARRLRERPSGRDGRVPALASGFQDHVTNPFDPGALVATIGALLDGRRS